MFEFLNKISIGGNEVWRLASFFILVLVFLVAGKLLRVFVERIAGEREKEGRHGLGILLKSLARPTVLIGLLVGVRFGLLILNISESLESMVSTALRVLTTAAIGYAAYCLVDVIDHYLSGVASKTKSKVDDMLIPLVGKSIRVTVFVIVILQVVESFSGKPVASILAGLGVGGLAVALAGQDTIKNFFGSLVIIGDKPFEIGDRIIIEGHDGPVEKVGFRSTKIRTLTGHLVTVPNSEIVNKTVENIGKRPHIRRLANITITYDTPPAKVQEAVAIIKDVLDNHEGMHPDFPPRVYFSDFNDCSLNILVIYWYHPPDYWAYMAFTERVNMELLKRFNQSGIEFAFPTQTVFLANDERRRVSLKVLKGDST